MGHHPRPFHTNTSLTPLPPEPPPFDSRLPTGLDFAQGKFASEHAAGRERRANPHRRDRMPGKLGLPEILLLLAVALLVFGPSKLADLGKGLGEGIKNFKSAVKDGEEGSEKKS